MDDVNGYLNKIMVSSKYGKEILTKCEKETKRFTILLYAELLVQGGVMVFLMIYNMWLIYSHVLVATLGLTLGLIIIGRIKRSWAAIYTTLLIHNINAECDKMLGD